MKNLDSLVVDLSKDTDMLRDLASKLMVTEPGQWETLIQYFKSLGYDIDLQSLKDKIREVAVNDKEKANSLIQNWYRFVMEEL